MAVLTKHPPSSGTELVTSKIFECGDYLSTGVPAAMAIARAVSKLGPVEPSANIPKQGALTSVASSASLPKASIRSALKSKPKQFRPPSCR